MCFLSVEDIMQLSLIKNISNKGEYNVVIKEKIHTLLMKSLELVSVFQTGLQISQGHVSLKQRLHQMMQSGNTAVENLSCSIIQVDRLPITCTKKMPLLPLKN